MNFFSTLRSFGVRKVPAQRINRRRRFGIESLETRAMLSVTSGDFNGDGREDLAIGTFAEGLPDGVNANAKSSAGAVNVIYGGKKGLTKTGNQFWNQDTPGINGVAASGDNFGVTVAAGDFNGDGFDDLAVGVTGDEVDGVNNAGAVNVIYGSATGLKATGDQLWTQNSSGINGAAAQDEGFGGSLAVGDFNNDGRDDLAVAVVDDVGAALNSGAVNVIYGSSSGLSAANDQLWNQNVSGIDGVAETNESFGFQLTTGDFNNDGRDDLVVGVFQDNVGAASAAGSVNVIYGSSSGLTASGDQLFNQDSTGVNDTAETFDQFSRALAAGDFNGDGFDDLAVTVTETASIGGQNIFGMVHVLFGSTTKLSGVGSQSFTRLDFTGVAETVGLFGGALTAGNYDNDDFDDLVIGASSATVTSINAGLVVAVYGSGTGLNAATGQILSQNSDGIQDSSEGGDAFGNILGSGDFDGDGRADLVAVAPFESIGTATNVGLVHVIYGFLTGLTSLGNQTWGQSFDGILGDQEVNDNFGR